MNILLTGFYGFRNIGDDLFLETLIDYFNSIDRIKHVFIICNENYYDYIADLSKVQFFTLRELSRFQRVKLIFKSDYIVWGGGTLNFGKPPRDLIRLQLVSRFLKRKFAFLGIGLEGVKPDMPESIKAIFVNANVLYLRDEQSYKFALQEFSASPKRIYLGGDLVFSNLKLYQPFVQCSSVNVPNDRPIQNLSFSGKHWWGDGRVQFYADQLKPLIEKFQTQIHLLPACVGNETNDNKFHQKLQQYLPKNYCQLHTWKRPKEFLEILSKMDFHIGNRLHSIILADILGIPNIGITARSEKIANYIQKTDCCIQARIVDFMVEIPLNQIETIFNHYQRPDRFLENEVKATKTCLQNIFQMSSSRCLT